MSASLGATTYTAVTWTSGDVITEAKLDNMIANDQAYDSHASQGLLLNNNKSLAGQNVAGSVNMNLVKVDTSDAMQIGEDNVGDHTVINAGVNKLVKIKVLRQDKTTNAYENNTVILTGWGYVVGDGVNGIINDTVTFGITFSELPVVLVSALSYTDSAVSDINSFTGNDERLFSYTSSISTTGFTAKKRHINETVASTNNRNYGYSWIAIGQLT